MKLVKFECKGQPLYVNPHHVAAVKEFNDSLVEIELVTGNKYRIQENINIVVAALEE
ncbi:flagellar FlbD family protein (plasmid) [Vibrio alginolyticus]|uniref:flagellar FlbD family protein n=1 Tax=Vibrio alginolyticus TaxID=663 RepID=UPI001C3CBE87|nr:flagellar FlbD family protein [Vibrio alginolyticus]URR30171.1 flagellar FlbD family protein [Vibrio alginolyticus]